MKTILRQASTAFVLLLIFCALGTHRAHAQVTMPIPVLIFVGQESYTANGSNFTRYRYNVFNMEVYPNEMFAAAPSLPPCGANTNSSRTWVDVFDQQAKRLNGFCNFGNHDDLNSIWFSLPEGELPPSWVYIELHDRHFDVKRKSNLAETTL